MLHHGTRAEQRRVGLMSALVIMHSTVRLCTARCSNPSCHRSKWKSSKAGTLTSNLCCLESSDGLPYDSDPVETMIARVEQIDGRAAGAPPL